MQKRKRHTGWIAALCIAVVIAAIAGVYCRFGGFGTGGCADTEEFSKYAVSVSELTVPDEAQIIALGEATHGNREFQQLRLDVLKVQAEKYGVRAFALVGQLGAYAVSRRQHLDGLSGRGLQRSDELCSEKLPRAARPAGRV